MRLSRHLWAADERGLKKLDEDMDLRVDDLPWSSNQAGPTAPWPLVPILARLHSATRVGFALNIIHSPQIPGESLML